jgi:hypothetical protein
MFSGHLCLIWIPIVAIAGVMRKGTPIPPSVRIVGGKLIMINAVRANGTQKLIMINAVRANGMQKLIMINAVRPNGTRVGVLMTRIRIVCVISGWTLVEMPRCLLIKGCLNLLLTQRMRGKETIIGHGDLALTIEEEWNRHLITKPQCQINRAPRLHMVGDAVKMLYHPLYMIVEGLALVEAL